MEINIAKDFSEIPGARYKDQGKFSAEEFREDILYPKFIESAKNNEKLIVNLDGGYGYGPSFVEETFGGLVRDLLKNRSPYLEKVKDIVIISNENVAWIEKIKHYINDALNRADY